MTLSEKHSANTRFPIRIRDCFKQTILTSSNNQILRPSHVKLSHKKLSEIALSAAKNKLSSSRRTPSHLRKSLID
ncbi:hypothetical protein SY212_16190 [Ligilactobacillus agilis]|uniref:Uncharacterized protein n=1 Tax=Ligilactobacillus agilis TaxID=1601 RepID=A0A6F9XMW4_9LACO|nr:hypothetical protein SY212_16190 [Ligilactobacillus agilis]